MPDWVSHVLIGLIICEIFRVRKKSLVLLGALMPDFFIKLIPFLKMPATSSYWLLLPTHLPIGAFLVTVIVTPLFRFDHKKVFTLISIGWLSHIIADLSVKYYMVNRQGLLLFPFSWRSFGFRLIWSEHYYVVLIVLVLVYFLIRLVKHIRQK